MQNELNHSSHLPENLVSMQVLENAGTSGSTPANDNSQQDYQLLLDNYGVTWQTALPRLPLKTNWPFRELTKPDPPKTRKLLHKRYLVVQTLKSDEKGDVLKCIDLRLWWKCRFRWCLVKEGKKNRSLDNNGRTIHDRLLWQQLLQTELQGVVPVPEVYDFFIENDNSYLVMQLIEGRHLHAFLDEQFAGQSWFALDTTVQLNLLDTLLQVIDYVDCLHRKGLIHRDLTPANFMIDTAGKLYLIDMELSYSETVFQGAPPFTYGSPGFMSPEQMMAATPTVKEDIYALGAMMITFFIGLPPSRFDHFHPRSLKKQLGYFTRHRGLATFISVCLQQKPGLRPHLVTIRSFIHRYRKEVSEGTHLRWNNPYIGHPAKAAKVIRQSILALQTGLLAGQDGLWYSPGDQQTAQAGIPATSVQPRLGFYSGISGVLYTVSQLQSAGFDTSSIQREIRINRDWLLQTNQDNLSTLEPGLYNGAAGLAITLAAGIESGWIISNKATIEFLNRLLRLACQSTNAANKPIELSLGNGMAGAGLAVLQCLPLIEPALAKDLLHHCVSLLLQQQQKDGSWIFTHPDYPGKKIKFPGYSHGIAGITSFLLSYYCYSKDATTRLAVSKALDWLASQARENTVSFNPDLSSGTADQKKGQEQPTLQWTLHSKSHIIDPSLDIGVTGIALVFIKAYEILRDEKYKVIAERALLDHPRYFQAHNYNLAGGMAGLGMVYLQAHRVLGAEEWLHRADHIAGVLLHSYNRHRENQAITWFTITTSFPTADFLSGNTGITYFLLHYQHPELLKRSFPF